MLRLRVNATIELNIRSPLILMVVDTAKKKPARRGEAKKSPAPRLAKPAA